METLKYAQEIKDIASVLSIKGTGKIKFKVISDDGSSINFQVLVYFVPEIPMRLISPQVIQGNQCGNTNKFSTFSTYARYPDCAMLEVMPKT